MRELVIRPQAQLDVEEAAIWYESRRPELGLRFLDELDYVIKRITATPFQFPEIHATVRRGLLKRFPYSVYFSVTDERVEVICSPSAPPPGHLEKSLVIEQLGAGRANQGMHPTAAKGAAAGDAQAVRHLRTGTMRAKP